MQVFDGWSYAVGDVVLGTNPVSSDVDRVAAIELALRDVLAAFGLEHLVPHCVLAHIDVQAKVEARCPGSTALWFQSLGGVADANAVFGIDVARMAAYAATRTGPFGMYFETGQGADATNGHGKGFDMVIHESRKYGFARALKAVVAEARAAAGHAAEPWVHVNDVAGFIGPEVFRTKEQLVRVCLEDTVMGKLHGLTIGLDICSTLHMDVSLDDLGWCIEQVMPANPAYLMALAHPERSDALVSDDGVPGSRSRARAVRLQGGRPDVGVLPQARRHRRRRPANGALRRSGVGLPAVPPGRGRHAHGCGDPRRGRRRGLRACVAGACSLRRGTGRGRGTSTRRSISRSGRLYDDAKACIYAELPAWFTATLAPALAVETRSLDRRDYVLHPPSGEVLDEASRVRLRELRDGRGGSYDVQVVVTDGLNAYSLSDEGHLAPYLEELRRGLTRSGFHPAPEIVVVTNGRVRAGYRIGETLFGGPAGPDSAAVVHVIGERPGNGHHTFSVYVTKLPARVWSQSGVVDHNHTVMISNVADTALHPVVAARQTVALLKHS